MGATEQTIQLLTRIAVAVEKLAGQQQLPKSAPPPPSVDLDGQYGDPEIRKDPPRWTGEPMAPRHMSQGTPEWLDSLASFYDWCAGQEHEKGDDKKARYKELDATRARGWADRLRAGWKQQNQDAEPPPPPSDGEERW